MVFWDQSYGLGSGMGLVGQCLDPLVEPELHRIALTLTVNRVALWNPSCRSRVDSGRRFNGGLDRAMLMDSRLMGLRVVHLGCSRRSVIESF